MHVCLLSDGYPPWERGGAQTVAAELARGYARRGNRVSAITTVEGRTDVGRSREDGVTVFRVRSPRPSRLLPYLTLRNPFVVGPVERLLDALDPDVVHAHNVHWLSNAVVRRASRRAPVVKTYHDAGRIAYGDFDGFLADVPIGDDVSPADYRVRPWRQAREQRLRYNPVRNRLNRRCLDRHVDAGVAVSHELRRALAANDLPCDGTIHNGVAPRTADPSSFRRAYGLGDAPVVLFGGRTGYTKGGAHLAAAFRRAVRKRPDATLVVTGDSEYVTRMRDIAGPNADVVTTGWLPRDRLRDAFAAATVVASPSVFLDPFPTVNLEAFAAGTPVVTTRFGGASELVTDGVDGFVVDPRDVNALADALLELLDPGRAAAFGECGRNAVTRDFTTDGMVDEYVDLLRRVREESAPR